MSLESISTLNQERSNRLQNIDTKIVIPERPRLQMTKIHIALGTTNGLLSVSEILRGIWMRSDENIACTRSDVSRARTIILDTVTRLPQ